MRRVRCGDGHAAAHEQFEIPRVVLVLVREHDAARAACRRATRAKSRATAGNPVSTSIPRVKYALASYPSARVTGVDIRSRITSSYRSMVSMAN